MNFRVTFTTTENTLGAMLAHFTRQQLRGVEIVPVEPQVVTTPTDTAPAPTGSGHPRIPGKTVLMQTGKEGKPRSPQAKRLLTLHEKLEANEGIGTVTRASLGIAAKRTKGITKYPSPGINRLVSEGWLTRIGEENGE